MNNKEKLIAVTIKESDYNILNRFGMDTENVINEFCKPLQKRVNDTETKIKEVSKIFKLKRSKNE